MCAEQSTQKDPKSTAHSSTLPPVSKPNLPKAEPTTIQVQNFTKQGVPHGTTSIDLTKAVPLIEKIITGISDRIGLDKNGGYGRNPEEIEAAKLIQSALNKGFEKLGSKERVVVDGDIRPGGSTAKAVEKYVQLENTKLKRERPWNIPSGMAEIGTVILSNLAKYEPKLIDPRFNVSSNVTGATINTLRPILANEKFLSPNKSTGADVTEVNRLITVAASKDDRLKNLKPSGKTLTEDSMDALNKLFITRDQVQSVGPATVRGLLRRAVEIDTGVQFPKLGGDAAR